MADIRNNELAQIHIARKQLGLDDETYRAVIRLISNSRTDSSGDLDYAERRKLLEHFKGRGFKARPPKKAGTSKPLSNEPQHKMIRGLWLELHALGQVLDPSEAAINRFVKNQVRVDRMEWLRVDQASQIIERLKSWLDRVQFKGRKGDDDG
jgi:phage gp16-like protein